MPTLTRDSRFFGLDLSMLGRDLRAAWGEMRHWPLFAWLTPQAPVRLLHADGGESRWLAAETIRPAPAGQARPARFTAVELPDDLVLRRSLVVPAMSEAEIADATALDAGSASPFPPGDTVWGYALNPVDHGQRQIDSALASRKQIEQYLKTIAPRLSTDSAAIGKAIEVWSLARDASPIVLAGFGETQRNRSIAAGRKLALGLLMVAVFLSVAIAITPTAQLRLRAIEAVNSFTALSQRVAPFVAKREALVKAADRLLALRELLSERIDPLRAIDVVTRVLPDDTWLQSLQIDGHKVSIMGQTDNAAALMQTIGAQPGLRDVRAPTAATRPLGAPKESFNIEFTLDPKAFQSQPVSSPATAQPDPDAAAPAVGSDSAGSESSLVSPSFNPTPIGPAESAAPPRSGRAALVIGGPKP